MGRVHVFKLVFALSAALITCHSGPDEILAGTHGQAEGSLQMDQPLPPGELMQPQIQQQSDQPDFSGLSRPDRDTVSDAGNAGSIGQEVSYDGIFNPEEAFLRGNEMYLIGQFEEAIALYELIAESGYRSSALFYNLGNAYYRSNKIPHSILNFERAALLSPGDEDIRYNLELARLHVRDRIEELPDFFLNRWWKGARNLLSAGQWAAISVLFFICILAFIAIFLISSTVVIKKIFFWLAVTFFFIFGLSFSLGLDQRNHLRNHNTAIVFSPSVSVKSSPDTGSTELFIIHEGTKVRVEDSLGDWRAVRLSDGNKGWLHKEAIRMI